MGGLNSQILHSFTVIISVGDSHDYGYMTV